MCRMHLGTARYDIISIWEEAVYLHKQKTAIIFQGSRFSFEDLDRMSNQIAHYLIGPLGLCKGDVCCLLMTNCPDYVCWWLGMAKVGILPFLINFNLKEKSLLHAITISKSSALVCDLECWPHFLQVGRR